MLPLGAKTVKALDRYPRPPGSPRRGFTSVKNLTDAIELWVKHWNDDPKPFVWHKTAAEFIAKVRRGRATLDHHTKSATDH